jgi:hypothetical protein
MASRIFSDVVPRVLGLLVFFGGVGMDAYVFDTSRRLYETSTKVPVVTTPIATPATPGAPIISPAFAQSTVNDLSAFTRQMVLLLLMCIAGSLIASLGIRLFFAVRKTDNVNTPTPTSPPISPPINPPSVP